MYDLILENRNGDRIELAHNLDYAVTEIDGLYPPSANIVTSETSLFDGAKYNSSKVNVRQIDIALSILRDAETNRIALYKVVKSKQYIKLTYRNGSREVYIEGYVSQMSVDMFSLNQPVTISILCPEPYFKDATEIIDAISTVVDAFTFPFAITADKKIPFSYRGEILELNIVNNGDVETGLTIEMYASGQVKNPAVLNRDTGEYFRLLTTLETGDVVYITTDRGNKRVRVFRDGVYVNLFNYIAQGSTWLQLQPGDNVFVYEAEDETEQYLDVRFVYRHLYEGV